MRISLPRSHYRGNQEAWMFYTRLLQETKALPGVQDAALTSLVPMAGGNTSTEVEIPGRSAAPDGSQPLAAWRVISPGYFRTLGVPLRGRDFDECDTAESQPVAIISEELALRSFCVVRLIFWTASIVRVDISMRAAKSFTRNPSRRTMMNKHCRANITSKK
jgi:hypothetical protein